MCDCKQIVNASLKERNMALSFNLFCEQDVFVETYKIDSKKRGKTVHMLATYCPFCGEKIKRKTIMSGA